jgi:SAM-dependent methyltransferase
MWSADSQLLALSRSSRSDCERLFPDLCADQQTPWNWASRQVQRFIPDTGAVLDLASGHGNFWIMQHHAARRYSLELIDAMSEPDTLPKRTRYTRCDLSRDLPPFEQTFDAIISVSSLEHIPEPARLKVLAWSLRHVRPGGIVAMSFGHFIGIRDMAAVQRKMVEHPYFLERGYGAYLPLDVSRILASLNVGGESIPARAMQYPGFPLYAERDWLADRDLCAEAFESYPKLALDADLRTVQSCEIFIAIRTPSALRQRVHRLMGSWKS